MNSFQLFITYILESFKFFVLTDLFLSIFYSFMIVGAGLGAINFLRR